MTLMALSGILFGGALFAGFLGSLTGLGGGIVIIPLLTIVLGVDIRYAVGASLVSVIATSSGAAAAYVREGFSNIRIGMFLEIATTLGALGGVFLALYLPTAVIAVVFGLVLLYSAYTTFRAPPGDAVDVEASPMAVRLRMNGTFPTAQGQGRPKAGAAREGQAPAQGQGRPKAGAAREGQAPADGLRAYNVRGIPGGFVLMAVAGVLSGLLGIGSGALKVIAMDRIMKIPFKVSTATSNFMIGVTAAASAGVYLMRGYIDPSLALPIMLGVLAGSTIGARFLARTRTRVIRVIFALTIVFLGLQMIYKGVTGRM